MASAKSYKKITVPIIKQEKTKETEKKSKILNLQNLSRIYFVLTVESRDIKNQIASS